jgi:hypothetical protein
MLETWLAAYRDPMLLRFAVATNVLSMSAFLLFAIPTTASLMLVDPLLVGAHLVPLFVWVTIRIVRHLREGLRSGARGSRERRDQASVARVADAQRLIRTASVRSEWLPA